MKPRPQLRVNLLSTSWWRQIFFELLDVAVFNLLHEGLALEEVALELSGELVGDDKELVAGHFGKRDGTACRN